MLAAKDETVDIAKRLKWDHRTIKKSVHNINAQGRRGQIQGNDK